MEEKNENGARINEFGEIERPNNKAKSITAIEVPSKKERKGNNVILKVSVKDLPKGEADIENLIAAVKRNGEDEKETIKQNAKIKSGFFINLGTRFTNAMGHKIREVAQKIEEKRDIKKQIKEAEKKEKQQIKKARSARIEEKFDKLINDKKFQKKAIATGIGVGIIIIAIPIFVKGCNCSGIRNPDPEPTSIVETTEEPTIEPTTEPEEIEIKVREQEPFDLEIYEIQNPYEILEGIVNSAGQEGLTANNIEGDTFDGNLYNADEQFGAETRASEGVEEFRQTKAEIEQNMQILIDPNATKDSKKIAVQRLLELNQNIEKIFNENQDFAEEYARRFEEASRAHEDSNTEKEVIAVTGMVENLKSELGLSSYNVSQLSMINQLLEQGYELDITSAEKDLRGTYEISGEAIREVMKKVNWKDAKETWSEFASFTKNTEIGENSTISLTEEREESDNER